MGRTRVLVVPGGWLTKVIGDIVEKDQAHLELIPADDFDSLPAVLNNERVDWVIAEISAEDVPPALIEAHRSQPGIRILGVVKGINDAHVIDLHPQHYEPGELGVDRLRELLREKTGVEIRLVKDMERAP